MADCNCKDCQGACKTKPGRFMPGEAEKVAAHLGITLKELFDEYLGVDWWLADENVSQDTFYLAPAIVNMEPGTEYPGKPFGTCVFFNLGMCGIHAVKPFECKAHMHDDTSEIIYKRGKEIAKAWVDHQKQVKDLLGRAPEKEDFWP